MPDWPHAPFHRLEDSGAYMVTSGTYRKDHFFTSPETLDYLHEQLYALAKQYDWQLQAWAIFSNHYHFIVQTQQNSATLRTFIRHFHSLTARYVNEQDGIRDRKVWFQYWETHLTFERSYFARLKYVHYNPVKHGLVHRASDYPWCSWGWFERQANNAFYKTVINFKIDRVEVPDDYSVLEVMRIGGRRNDGDKSGGKPPHSKDVVR